MKQFIFTINGNEYTVDVNAIEDSIAQLEVNGTPYEVEIHKKVKRSKTPRIVTPPPKENAKPEIDKKGRGESHSLLAPLPGSILSVKVQPGDIIEKGQLLMLMEAMKMENQVLSDRKGVIESIQVNVGDSVLQGDILVKII